MRADDYRQIADTPGTALCCRYRGTDLTVKRITCERRLVEDYVVALTHT